MELNEARVSLCRQEGFGGGAKNWPLDGSNDTHGFETHDLWQALDFGRIHVEPSYRRETYVRMGVGCTRYGDLYNEVDYN